MSAALLLVLEQDPRMAVHVTEKVEDVSRFKKTRRDIGGASYYEGPTPQERHFEALKRILDRKEPDYVE